jgi:hypothetical protein
MSLTYKNTNNCLLFFSAKFFLDAIDTIFNFRYVESKDNRWILEFRAVNEIIWQRKPISICLTTNHIETTDNHLVYQIKPSDNNIEEDVHILKLYKTLQQLFVDALQPNCILANAITYVSVSDLKIFGPYHFDYSTFPNWLKQPGQPTIRISNALFNNNYANVNFAFNNWKYITLLQRETSTKKRKLEIEDLPAPVPVATTNTCEIQDTSTEIKIES